MRTHGSEERRERMRHVALHWQLLATAAPLAALALFALAAVADHLATARLERSAAVHLDAVRVAAEAGVAAELARLEGAVRRAAADTRTAEALRALSEATRASEDDPRTGADALAGAPPAGSAAARRARWLQAQYVDGGSPPADGDYARAHAAWHPHFAALAAREGFADLFLVRGADALVLYDVAKWPLFQTSLLDGPWAGSRAGALVRRLRAPASPATVLLADVSPFAPAGGAPLAFAAAPVFADGAVLGAVVAAFDTTTFARALSGGRRQGLGLGAGGELFLIGDDGTLRSAPLQPVAAEDAGGGAAAAAPVTGLKNAAVGVARYGGRDGRERLASVGPAAFGELGWRVVAARDAGEADAAAAGIARRVYGAAAVLSLLFAAALAGLAWWLAVPLRHLAAALSRLRASDPRAHAPVLGHGDAAALGLAVNRLLAQSRDEAAAARRAREGDARSLAAAIDAWPRADGGAAPHAGGELAPLAAALARLEARLAQAPPSRPPLAEVTALQAAAEHLRRESARQLDHLADADSLAAAQAGSAAEAGAALLDELGVLAVNAALAAREAGAGAAARAAAASAAAAHATALQGGFDAAEAPLRAAGEAVRRLCHAADIVAREAEAVAAAPGGRS